MKSSSPIFALVLSAAVSAAIQAQNVAPAPAQAPVQSQVPAQAAPPPRGPADGLAGAATMATPDSNAGNALLRRVLATVDAHRSIAAKVRHKVDLLGRTMYGTGVYLQQGRGPERLLRFELDLKMIDRTGSMQEVCDGTSLWLFEDLSDVKSLARVDMARVRRARPKALPQQAPVATSWFGLGGLPKLLANLEGSVNFGPVVESRLDEVRVLTLEGGWKPARLAAWLPDQKAAIDAGAAVDLWRLSPNIPDRVTLHVGVDDLFPYRIEYWRVDPKAKNPTPGDRGKLMVVMELYEVQLNGPIDPRQFTFSPGDAPPVDRTQNYLDKLNLEEIPTSSAARPGLPRR